MKYLKNKTDGTIYEWDEILAANPKCEEVTEEEAYPERFLLSRRWLRLSRRFVSEPKNL
jgi:hypothetical protein